MYKIGNAVVLRKGSGTLNVRIPEGGAIISQATVMGLMENGEAADVTMGEVRVLDKLHVCRYRAARLPGKVAAHMDIEIDVTCAGAIAVSVMLRYQPRAGSAEIDEGSDIRATTDA